MSSPLLNPHDEDELVPHDDDLALRNELLDELDVARDDERDRAFDNADYDWTRR